MYISHLFPFCRVYQGVPIETPIYQGHSDLLSKLIALRSKPDFFWGNLLTKAPIFWVRRCLGKQ